ncbi:MAG: rRNA maturation RNase YbeY [Anaerolineae bacterium]|nr:rRNA maturation RNase YbeY [Anaerolineae bacterium]MCB9129388.1 rRNA maturation RNase YbeY [Anaerolineales bacterium]MCB0231401.1 rRNA maturation RNase YbeY [Anaerolineae bacterium]MCB0237002.1 rRNA maturation RNase YbeY [Anaerolineae bacterium]MCB0237176.1 rRNA maturation RNase YbeY [Anaerolineae bacterium]
MPLEIDVQIDEELADQVAAEGLQAAVEATLLREGVTSAGVSLMVAGDELLHELNLEYRGIDGPTDVLSFSAREEAEGSVGTFVVAPDALDFLGDIVISLPYAARQAVIAGHSTARELHLLAIHGTLHLLGYDHATEEEEAVMWAKQDEILASL